MLKQRFVEDGLLLAPRGSQPACTEIDKHPSRGGYIGISCIAMLLVRHMPKRTSKILHGVHGRCRKPHCEAVGFSIRVRYTNTTLSQLCSLLLTNTLGQAPLHPSKLVTFCGACSSGLCGSHGDASAPVLPEFLKICVRRRRGCLQHLFDFNLACWALCKFKHSQFMSAGSSHELQVFVSPALTKHNLCQNIDSDNMRCN